MRKFLIASAFLSVFSAFAGDKEPEMADALRADGKIWVVVAVVAVIFVGIVIYLFMLDRKLGKIEKERREK